MAAEEVRESFGDYLIRERNSRNITTEELAKATHLSVHFIEALEHNNFSSFSQKESIHGFLKLYARHLSLDYEAVLKRYQKEEERILKQRVHQEMSFAPDYASPVARATEAHRLPGLLGRWVIPAFCVVIAVVIALYVYLSPEKAQMPTVPSSAESSATAKNFQTAQSAPIQPIVDDTRPPSAALPETSPATPSESRQPSASISTAAAVPEKEKVVVVGNSDSKRYHLPGMRFYKEVKAYHRVLFDSEEEAIKAGYFKAAE